MALDLAKLRRRYEAGGDDAIDAAMSSFRAALEVIEAQAKALRGLGDAIDGAELPVTRKAEVEAAIKAAWDALDLTDHPAASPDTKEPA
jgi:hypothetical protein